MNATAITIDVSIEAPIDKVWDFFNSPKHVMQWNQATDDWHTPKAANDLIVGGSFSYTMAAKDASFSFIFSGIYEQVELHNLISYTLEDGRHVVIKFEQEDQLTYVTETFEPEGENPITVQKTGWQMILDNFKKYVENN
jgi:uncharacterized protein YndB with AHSA1/START domain